jgi:DNA-directed RNA polymerase specialized sigma24 family protein
MRKVRGIKRIADSLHERIAAHIIPLADLFERQTPATFRGWTRACLDHFLRRYREADQEAANADYKPVFLDADPATVMVKRMRPRRFERPLLAPDTANTADVVAASLPPSKQNLAALKDRAPSLLPLLKGNEIVVFEAIKSATSQRDIANATGLTEGAVSKILDRIISKAG